MCYSTDNLVNPRTEVTYDKNLPYGIDGYRTDCNKIEVSCLCTVQSIASGELKINTTATATAKATATSLNKKFSEGNYGCVRRHHDCLAVL